MSDDYSVDYAWLDKEVERTVYDEEMYRVTLVIELEGGNPADALRSVIGILSDGFPLYAWAHVVRRYDIAKRGNNERTFNVNLQLPETRPVYAVVRTEGGLIQEDVHTYTNESDAEKKKESIETSEDFDREVDDVVVIEVP